MIPGVDAAAIVDHLVNRKTELGAAADLDVAGNAGEIFQRVVDQVGKDLFQREAVADEVGNGSMRIWASASPPDAPPW